MFTSSVSLFVTHVFFFYFIISLNITLNGGIYVISCLFFLLGGPIILQSGEKVTVMIMLTSSEDGCQSSITFARMNVMARSLYEENTSIEEVCCTNCSVDDLPTCKGETLNAQYTHMWRTCAYVDWVTSCQYLPSLSFAIGQAAISPPSAPNQVQH